MFSLLIFRTYFRNSFVRSVALRQGCFVQRANLQTMFWHSDGQSSVTDCDESLYGELGKRGHRKREASCLTDHLNTIDKTNSIKFTHEEDLEGKMPFLDTLIQIEGGGGIEKKL